jgi:hypothetical protein
MRDETRRRRAPGRRRPRAHRAHPSSRGLRLLELEPAVHAKAAVAAAEGRHARGEVGTTRSKPVGRDERRNLKNSRERARDLRERR